MSKLMLTNITKTYRSGEVIHALKGISLGFRANEFVSILGPSGCGKTTLLNIIGGLDRYDEGDLLLGGRSTQHFKDKDWDAYRNHSIGFVFQNYNLISHLTVLQNVEMAMTLSGVSPSKRRDKAKQALHDVGLGDKLNKKPNQLSGGQMQRVAIARALINDPEIILADEPTGALDSQTSLQVMEILKKISATKLVIMVTHNRELADEYSSRIIELLDGEVQSDSNPLMKDQSGTKQKDGAKRDANQLNLRQTSMSLPTALALSFRNLLTKKGRTLITSFAGSIGIIGVALVLALSTGLSGFISQLQSEVLSGVPLTVSESPQMAPASDDNPFAMLFGEGEKFTDEDVIHSYDMYGNIRQHQNVLTQEYFEYVEQMENELSDEISAISYGRNVDMNVLAKGGDNVVKFETSLPETSESSAPFAMGSTYWQELPEDSEFILSLYDLIGEGSRYPTAAGEVALVVDEYNRVDKAFLDKMGIQADDGSLKLSDLIGKTLLKVIPNDSFYSEGDNGLFAPASVESYARLYEEAEGLELTITGVLRMKESALSAVGYLSEGIVYTPELTDYVLDQGGQSAIAKAQLASERDVLTNSPFASEEARKQRLRSLGADAAPSSINIYPKDFAGKDRIKEYLDAYNADKEKADQILYSDVSEMIGSMIQQVLNIISYVLVGFAAISLVVSTIMIGIITYVSVLERTKEIGILRSIGARKKDISRVFNAETAIVGLTAGAIGVLVSYALTILINSILSSLAGIDGVAQLTVVHAVSLIAGSILLTLVAGVFPARTAARKDPVTALRTES
ncbi:ABC transporter ATP-binding protein/permease [Paenibacillus senegalensis]|uniref:ABC transporter ATP-binding protein/permease n=1 Tax=Paenibacillus senegalensis TaxID=1465766 RepID=UPI00028A40BE|nr:ABC transporter ATP-binding protein/permease [Paenibacillus senegalensis]